MLEQLDALVTLAEAGTMTRAATRLRLTQSAISKRIASLEANLSVVLIERQGRHVRLTPAASELAAKARPLLAEIRDAMSGQRQQAVGNLVLGVAESVLTSWAPRLLDRARQALPQVRFELHAHRSPVCVDAVRAGEFTLAIVTGRVDPGLALWNQHLLDEELVLIGLGSRESLRHAPISVLTIETQSATFRSLAPQLAALRARGVELRIERELESFAAVVQLGRFGFGPALVPLPLARALGLPAAMIRHLPPPGLSRPVSLVGRKSALSRPSVAAFRDVLVQLASKQA